MYINRDSSLNYEKVIVEFSKVNLRLSFVGFIYNIPLKIGTWIHRVVQLVLTIKLLDMTNCMKVVVIWVKQTWADKIFTITTCGCGKSEQFHQYFFQVIMHYLSHHITWHVASKFKYIILESASASGGLRPPDPYRGFASWTSLETSVPQTPSVWLYIWPMNTPLHTTARLISIVCPYSGVWAFIKLPSFFTWSWFCIAAFVHHAHCSSRCQNDI